MSLGDQSDDHEFELAGLLREAATQMVIHGKGRESAFREAAQLQSERRQAEIAGEVERDEHGNTSAYLQDSLNPTDARPEQLTAIALKYQELCAEEGIDAV